jgi:hypothetical protein
MTMTSGAALARLALGLGAALRPTERSFSDFKVIGGQMSATTGETLTGPPHFPRCSGFGKSATMLRAGRPHPQLSRQLVLSTVG